jgi:outer membrane protein assembly factor BamD
MGIFTEMIGNRRLARLGALTLLGAALGCHRFDPRGYTQPEALFAASMREFRAGRFARAHAGFQQLTFELAGRDTLLPPVRFYLAESLFGQRDLVTATREFRRVADEHPTHELAPQALLRAADAYAELWRRPELDPANGQTALATYQELQGRYPDSRPAIIAGLRIRELNEQFAAKEYQNGLFYFRRGAYDSAILYLRNLIATYPNSILVPEAYVRLVRAYRAIGYSEERDQICDHARQLYPTRDDVREACGDGSLRR